MEQMNEQQLQWQERQNTGTSWTHNESFDKNGYLILKNLWSVDELYHPLPAETGQINYWGKNIDQFNHNPVEQQVEGSLARYNHPQYRPIHTGIRLKLEEVIGRKLYNTYFYDRFYKSEMSLHRHADRDACEISVSVHISTDLKEPWAFRIKTPDTYTDKKKTQVLVPGEWRDLYLEPGDGVLYKGSERPHERIPMPYGKQLFGWKKKSCYYHNIFFHYVLADGERAHCYMDRAK
jgi:hypothetical protein